MAPLIVVNGNTADAAKYKSLSDQGAGFALLIGKDILTPDQKKTLDGLGVKIQGYVYDKTYLCQIAGLAKVRGLTFLECVIVYPPEVKPSATLQKIINTPGKDDIQVDIALHDGITKQPNTVADEVAANLGIKRENILVTPRVLRLTVDKSK